jgi:hypothetical protein
MTLPGVDVASFQGRPASWMPAAGHIAWAAVKITELQPSRDRYVNPDAAADWAALKNRGLGRVAYMFGHPATDPVAAASFFITELRQLGLENGDGVCLDHEVADGLHAHAVAGWAAAVLDQLHKQLHRTPLLYTFLNFAETGNCAGLGSYPLWIADPSSPPGRPRVPGPWKSWAIHQYAISGAIDRDIANYPTAAAMAAALGAGPDRPAPAGPARITADGKRTLAQLGGHHGAAGVLRATAEHSPGGHYSAAVAAWINEKLGDQVPPGGTHWYVPR